MSYWASSASDADNRLSHADVTRGIGRTQSQNVLSRGQMGELYGKSLLT